jgi:hypothetical protein
MFKHRELYFNFTQHIEWQRMIMRKLQKLWIVSLFFVCSWKQTLFKQNAYIFIINLKLYFCFDQKCRFCQLKRWTHIYNTHIWSNIDKTKFWVNSFEHLPGFFFYAVTKRICKVIIKIVNNSCFTEFKLTIRFFLKQTYYFNSY